MGLLTLIRSRLGRGQPLAPRVEVACDASGNRGLVFNLAWRSIASGGGRQDAVRIARAARATHAVVRAGQVGMGILPQRSVRPGARLLPAALVAARQHSGTAVCCLEVTPGEYWLALTIHGAPTSTDLFLSGVSADEALKRARAILDSLDARAEATLHTNIPGCTLPGARPYAPADMLEAPVAEGDVLRPVPRPPRVRALGLGILLVAAAVLAGHQHRARTEQARRAQLAAHATAAVPDLQSAWEAAVTRWAADVPLPSASALQAVRSSLGGLPVLWYGWDLAQAVCRASGLESGPPSRRAWQCEAEYRRGPGAHLNREMALRAPAGWALRFLPLEGVQLYRTVDEPAEPLRPHDLLPVLHYEVEVASRLQRLSSAFAGDLRLVFTPVSVPAPTDATGQALGPPPQPVLPSRAEFQLRGPLRSIDAAIAAGVTAHWHALHLSYQAPAAGASGSVAGAAASALMVELKGEFIAKP